jgi:biopolymer transport protein ExbD
VRRVVLHPPHQAGRVNVTPLIDVLMCMIVFYLIVGKLASDVRAPVALPESRRGSPEHAQDALFINVVPGDSGQPAELVIESTTVTLAQLPILLRARLETKPSTIVHLRADRSLRYGAIAPTVAACREAGVPSVRLATEQSP